MENKYYTPEISEFHVGFEYEIYVPGTDTEYTKKIFTLTEVGFIQNVYDQNLQEGWFRVKYLDKEDIESLDWKSGLFQGLNEDSFTYQDYQLYWQDNQFIQIYNFDAKIIFEGIIKNKSELKKLLTQLEIV